MPNLISPFSGLNVLFGDTIQGRRASRLPLAIILRAFGAAMREVLNDALHRSPVADSIDLFDLLCETGYRMLQAFSNLCRRHSTVPSVERR